MLASRQIEASAFKAWQEKYEQARASQEDKKTKMEALQEEIEVGLHVIGATAIEDKLQDEVRKYKC